MAPSFHASPEDLLNDARWLRRLAGSLVADPSVADDLVQETWLATLGDAPARSIFAPRAWLRRVLLNAATHQARRNTLRIASEHGAARAEALPSTEEFAERAELQRTLAGAVLTLAEPYRSTILWRYFGDLSAEEIAASLGVPSSTVRNRLRRGLELLRSALDRRGVSDWQSRCLVLGNLKSAIGAADWIHKGVLMGTKVKLGILIVAAAASLVLWFEFDRSDTPALNAPAPEVSDVIAPALSPEADPARGTRMQVPAVEEQASLVADSAPVVNPAPPIQQLEALRDQLRSQIEDSLLGHVDVAYYLELAELMTKLEPGSLSPEPSPFGAQVFPLKGTPEGMHAEYWIRSEKNANSGGRMDTIRITLDNPTEPYVVGGVERKSPEVGVSIWHDPAGKVRHFGIMTQLPFRRAPPAKFTAQFMIFSYDVEKPQTIQGSVGSSIGGASPDISILVVGEKWPDLDALDQFNAGMHSIHGRLGH